MLSWEGFYLLSTWFKEVIRVTTDAEYYAEHSDSVELLVSWITSITGFPSVDLF